jgi:hypothetical protein
MLLENIHSIHFSFHFTALFGLLSCIDGALFFCYRFDSLVPWRMCIFHIWSYEILIEELSQIPQQFFFLLWWGSTLNSIRIMLVGHTNCGLDLPPIYNSSPCRCEGERKHVKQNTRGNLWQNECEKIKEKKNFKNSLCALFYGWK